MSSTLGYDLALDWHAFLANGVHFKPCFSAGTTGQDTHLLGSIGVGGAR